MKKENCGIDYGENKTFPHCRCVHILENRITKLENKTKKLENRVEKLEEDKLNDGN